MITRQLTSKQKLEIDEHCFYALEAIMDGSDLNTLKKMLNVYKLEENWLACEGIRKAIAFSEKATLSEVEQFKTEIEWKYWQKSKDGSN
jgi:predicted  nucleic acid-binding Zn ribbon protein